MAKIPRKTQKIFGEDAGADQIAQIGSLAASAPVFSTDPDDIQALQNYLDGWFNVVIGGNSPAIEDMNALCYLFAYQLAYGFQAGIPEWDSETTYYIGSIVNDASNYTLYVSGANDNLNQPLSDYTKWVALPLIPGAKNVGIGRSDYNSLAYLDTSVLGRIAAVNNINPVTISVAANAVVTLALHGLSTGDTAYFTTDGTLPSPLIASTIYYITTITSAEFRLSTSLANLLAGVYITTTTAGSGTFTVHAGGFAPKAGSIINNDINAAAAIEGSKIQAASASNVGTLNYYSTTDYTVQWRTNGGASGTKSSAVYVKATRIGRDVTLVFQGFSNAVSTLGSPELTAIVNGSASTVFTLDAAYRPPAAFAGLCTIVDNGTAVNQPGMITVATNGGLNIFRDLLNTGFTSAACGLASVSLSISYSV